MSDSVDPYALPVAKALDKLTFGTVAGDKDPIAALFQIRVSDIEDRMDAKDAFENPKQPTAPGQAAAGRVKAMERDRQQVRARRAGASVALVSEDKDLLSASGGKGKQGRASSKLGA